MSLISKLQVRIKDRILKKNETKVLIDKFLDQHKGLIYKERKAGDVFLTYRGGGVGHANLVGPDTYFRIDSVYGETNGVRKVSMRGDECDSLVFRFKNKGRLKRYNEDVAYRAAKIAEEWCDKTGYSKDIDKDGRLKKGDRPERQTKLALGASYFGRGAAGRLQKYLSRTEAASKAGISTAAGSGSHIKLNPKNVTCAEMVVLAYQLSLPDAKSPDFLKLDPKHTSPSRLIRYLIKSPYWEFVGMRGASAQVAAIDEHYRAQLAQNNAMAELDDESDSDEDNAIGHAGPLAALGEVWEWNPTNRGR